MTMAEEVGFTSMAGAHAEGDAPEIRVGMLGYAFMGKAHANALKKLPYMMYPPTAVPVLAAICGRSESAVKEAARRYGFASYYTDYRQMIDSAGIDVFDNGGPNDAHAEPSIYAAKAGRHVFCEKPLGRTAEESARMVEAVQAAGVRHMVAFNYRFVPAIVQARRLIESGALGRIFHFRAVYLQEWIIDPNFPKIWRLDKSVAGSGALGDLGAHIIDLARYLVAEPTRVMGMTKTFIPERPLPEGGMGTVDVDDAFISLLEFANGAIGTVEASRFAQGRKNYNCLEINGENGSIRFNLERMNELEVFWANEEPKETRGFHNVLVTESYHPYWSNWWPHGHIIGWEHTFVHEFNHFFEAIAGKHDVAPYGADFVDGYRNSVICDAIVASSESGRAVDIRYDF
jgi:predicted dehydrogenase